MRFRRLMVIALGVGLLAGLVPILSTRGGHAINGPTQLPASASKPAPTPSPTDVASTPTNAAALTPGSVVPRPETPSTVWLINTDTGAEHTLFSERIGVGYPSVSATFSGNDSVVLRLSNIGEERVFTLGGVEQARRPIAPFTALNRCKRIDVLVAEIDAQRYEVNCGSFSPDGNRMLYNVDVGTFATPTGYIAPVWDQWLIDLRSGQRTLLQQGLRSCGGCDGFYPPQWSPSGRYVIYAELYSGADGGSVFLSDTERGTTRRIAAGPSYMQMGYEPDWATNTDLLLRPGDSGGSVVEDLTTARVNSLAMLTWPARFDATAHLAYSPAGAPPKAGGVSTRVVSLDGILVATLPGAVPNIYGYRGETHGFRVFGTADGVAATLESVTGCSGTVIYHPHLPPAGRCIPAATGAVFSPSLGSVAFSRKAHDPVPGHFALWDIVLVDPRTGVERVLARDAGSDAPPLITWGESGFHVLVHWPVGGGI